MATIRSLQGIDWMVRTYAPALLTTCGRLADASTLAGLQPITNTARLNSAITRLDNLETQLKTEYAGNPLWDAAWSQTSDQVRAEVQAQCPIPPDELMVDPDQLVKRAYKTFLRGLEMVACQFVADGGGGI